MTRAASFRVPALLGAILILGSISVATAAPIEPWMDKVHPAVLTRAESGPVEFLVVLEERADLAAAASFETKAERGAWVVSRLREVAERSQASLVERLAASGVDHRAFWITNMVWVRGGLDAVREMAQDTRVARIAANPTIAFTPPTREYGATTEGTSVEWGIQKVMAEQLWAMGYRGAGVVVAGQDTGYEWSHPAIRDRYRGWNGVSADHDYNWHDSVHSGGGVCGPNSAVPCDDHDHGTHTMGTMVGDDGGSNRIGMAPDARWIGCRNMDVGNGTPASYSECFEWLVAPTDLAGQNPDPSKAPHVINNSWLCPESENCEFDTLQDVVENTRAAGILVVASAGNSGSGCSTVTDPPAIYEAALTVGATSSSDAIASFSSRGPVTVDSSNRLKPEVSAPGVSVRSSVRGGGYATWNGTSMAGPHVAGLAALLLSARPDLEGKVDELTALLTGSAFPLTSGQNCGGMSGGEVPNPIYGFGRIDAVETLLGDVDGDGTDNLGDCKPIDASVWGAPGPVQNLQFGGADRASIAWSAPLVGGGTELIYDVLRSDSASGFLGASCLAKNDPETSIADGQIPDQIFYYLVRSKSSCGSSLGTDSAGGDRPARACLLVGG